MAENSAGDEDVDMVQMIDYSIYTCEDNYEEIFKYLESPMNVCVIIEGKNGRIPSSHPKVTKDFFRANIKNERKIESLKFSNQGKLIIETRCLETAIELLSLKKIFDIPVVTRIPQEYLTNKFLLRSIPTDVNLKDLAEELEYENSIKIKEIRRFTYKKDKRVLPSETVLITTYGAKLPEHVKYWYIRSRISLFIDRPRQCSSCFKFDHIQKNCRNSKVCENCSGNHDSKECKEKSICILCTGNHKATDHSCPKREEEMRFLKFKAVNQLPIIEARRKFREQNNKSTFSNTARASSINQGITKKEVQELIAAQMTEIISLITQNIQKQFENNNERLMIQINKKMEEAIPAIVESLVPQSSSPERSRKKSTTKKKKEVHSNQMPGSFEEWDRGPFSASEPQLNLSFGNQKKPSHQHVDPDFQKATTSKNVQDNPVELKIHNK